jgi:hypothetical protein
MNARKSYGFQQLVELCKQTHQEIPQTTFAKSGVDCNNFLPRGLKKAKPAFYSQACAYYPKLTENEISQQSADQLPRSHIKPVEFDGIRIQAELRSPEPEQEDRS